MDLDYVLKSLDHLPQFDKWAWGVVGLITLAATGLILFGERRYFAARGKAGSWLSLRLLSLFILLPATAGVIVMTSLAISGPEALAYFYFALLVLGPLVWFAGHTLCGRLLRPAFSTGESRFMAASGLFILILPFLAATVAQGPIFHASHSLSQSALRNAPAAELPYAIGPVRHFTLPTVGLIHTQSLIAPAGFELERIDRKVGENWSDTATSTHEVFCQDGQNLHLMWSAREAVPMLRFYWRRNGQRVQADFTPADATVDPAEPGKFTIGFRPDGIDPPVPIPRSRAAIAYFVAPDRLYFNSLTPLQPGETFANDCIMPGYQRVAWEKEGPPQAVALMFFQSANAPYLRAEIRRPADQP
ncbi:MAG: hypothetical protein CVU33_20750 [Betaproteobacteria bacterium HGW-Betaproteobacteria-6]|jgi:hypothetical protein|nr:MAG: hypothetical protein CVU33_20750 [Betaproteobacteria bacterium HGW-Betaproteobacteria-6]